MGDRISLEFRKDGESSVALFSHWQGMSFVAKARAYAYELVIDKLDRGNTPLDRLEPRVVMIDFLRHLIQENSAYSERVEGDIYLEPDSSMGDNSDNGHHVIDLDEIESLARRKIEDSRI